MGPIAPEILAEHPENVFHNEKATFSMLNDPVAAHLASLKRKNVVLYGLEAHVCMRQTAFDLLELEHDVHLVVDACSSMGHHDRNVGIESMKEAGVTLITFQSLIFELIRGADHPQFK